MAHIAADIDSVVAAHSARCRLGGLGGAEDDAAGCDDTVALPDHGDHRARGHVGEEGGEERLLDQVLVVLLEQRLVCLHHLEGHELEPLLLKAPGTQHSTNDAIPGNCVSAAAPRRVACTAE